MINQDLNQELYSIIIKPSSEVINEVKVLKDKLASRIGNYASRNSEAHITLVEFEADDIEINFYKSYIVRFCYEERFKIVSFDNLICSNLNGCVFLLPNKNCKYYLHDLLHRFRKGIKSKNIINGTGAHISIAQRLNSNTIEVFRNLYEHIELKFQCERIALRKLNPIVKQFDLVEEFYFSNAPQQIAFFL